MADMFTPVVADTHAFIWFVQADRRLPETARARMESTLAAGSPVFVSAATAVELRYLLDKGTIPESEFHAYRRVLRSGEYGIDVAPVDLDVASAVDAVPRAQVADPFDRMIAATAVALGVPLVTADKKLHDVAAVEAVW